jgi:hypothetical protein
MSTSGNKVGAKSDGTTAVSDKGTSTTHASAQPAWMPDAGLMMKTGIIGSSLACASCGLLAHGYVKTASIVFATGAGMAVPSLVCSCIGAWHELKEMMSLSDDDENREGGHSTVTR